MTVDYRARRGHDVNVQLSILSKEHRTREDIEKAITHRVRTGRNPRGYKLRITAWRGREQSGPTSDLWNALGHFEGDSDLDHDTPQPVDPDAVRDWESEGEDEA